LTRFPPALVVAATLLLAAVGAGPAAADAPQLLGQTALADVDGSCTRCSAVQLSNAGSPSTTYRVPSSGVFTKFRVFVADHVVAGEDWVQPRTFRTSSPLNATVISEGPPLYLVDTPAVGVQTFYGRIRATAGDVLGARFNIGISTDATPVHFPAAPGDVVAVVHPLLDPAVGESFMVPPPAGSPQRVNMQAVLESDADGDGSGDTSQDLCPGDGAVSEGACSGTLFGSRLQGRHTTDAASCTAGGSSTCLRVQKTIAGVSTAAAVDGVVVRWRVLGGAPGSYRVRIVAPAGGSSYTILRSSAAETVAATPPLTEAISTFATRLPIPAGGYVGLNPAPTAPRFLSSAIGSKYGQLPNDGDGMVASMSTEVDGELFYDADIEPDADHDEYGDVTQDACPSDAATQGACSPPPPAPPGGGTPTPEPGPPAGNAPPAATTPVISGLTATHARFRVKRRGAVVARAHAGTTLRLRLSEAAAVTFAVAKGVRCGRKRCARWASLHRFTRNLAAGQSSLAYSGRYRRRGTVRSLRPGRHRLTAVATNAAGRASKASRIRLTVRP
jgi:hypothetical protein